MKRVLLGLGSNKGFDGKSCLEILSYACHDLASLLKNVIVSSVYKTKAMYVTNQDDFYNMVVCGFVSEEYNPFTLLDEIHIIENKYGRDREKEIRFGPRSLDIDIEIFGDDKINTVDLQIPHIRFAERAFVLVPMLEILQKDADDLLGIECHKYLRELKKDADKIECVMTSDKLLSLTGGSNGSDSRK